jgi:hypothetical protein
LTTAKSAGVRAWAGHSRVAYVTSLVSCETKDEVWLKRFVEREMDPLVHHSRGFFADDLARLRDFVRPSPARS